ncbi:MAG TPA: hypothetical protein VGY30_04860 [Solirubrobacteraceae bacterium]|jgi:hypothetical protein|nr:hypothetical protein [Solirubrobacteraceae bacterium]
MPRFRIALIPLLAVLLLSTTGLGSAAASHNETMFFEAPRDLVGVTPKARAKALVQLQWLGVKALRVELVWRNVAPGSHSARKPSFDATNPASYNWGEYDPLLAEAQRLKWQVLLTVTAPAPKWATAARKDYVTRPSDTAFREFMTAVGKHFGGAVSLFAIWNEANHPAFLLPQFSSNGKPASPRLYRGLFEAGYEGLKASGIASPKVLMGETAPVGSDSLSRQEIREKGLEHDVAPLAFLREALCLNSHYHRSGACEELHPYGYAHHAYTVGSPYSKPKGADSVTIGVLSRLSSALDKAAAAHAIPAHLPIYLTEFGIQSYPNHELGAPQPQQAEYDAIAEKIAWSDPRVAAFSQYLLRDDKLGGKPGSSVHGGFVGFQTGLEEYRGKRKPLYYGFPVPLVVSRHGGGYSLWGLVRPTSGATNVTVLYATGKSSHYRTLKIVRTDATGAWSFNSAVHAGHWRVLWVSSTGVKHEGPPIGAT